MSNKKKVQKKLAPVATSTQNENKKAKGTLKETVATETETKVENEEKTPTVEIVEEVPTPKTESSKTTDKKPVDDTIPSIVETKEGGAKTSKLPVVESIVATMNGGANSIDHNRAIDLAGMIERRFLSSDSTASAELKAAMGLQFDAMIVYEGMAYAVQMKALGHSFGFEVSENLLPSLEKAAKEVFGITLKSLPSKTDPTQRVINFDESMSEKTKTEIAKEIEKGLEPIPEPSTCQTDKEKEDAIRIIFGQKTGMGQSLLNALAWSRKAYGFSDDTPDALILAKLVNDNPGIYGLKTLKGLPIGTMDKTHSIIGAHALLSSWCKVKTDDEIADFVKILAAYSQEQKVISWNENAPVDKKSNFDTSFDLLNQSIASGLASNVIDGILNKESNVISGKNNINTEAIRKTLVSVYGDSDQIIKDKLDTIVKAYATPILRLSKYTERSTYGLK